MTFERVTFGGLPAYVLRRHPDGRVAEIVMGDPPSHMDMFRTWIWKSIPCFIKRRVFIVSWMLHGCWGMGWMDEYNGCPESLTSNWWTKHLSNRQQNKGIVKTNSHLMEIENMLVFKKVLHKNWDNLRLLYKKRNGTSANRTHSC